MASGRVKDGQFDFSGGVDSGKVTTIASERAPNGLKRNQLAWLSNATCRGGGITCRTGWTYLTTLHDGSALYQGGWMYQPRFALPYLVVSIGGVIYQVRVDTDNSVNNISGILTNPATEPQAYFCQGEEFLVIQAGDNLTLPLFWDGTTMTRSNGIIGPAAVPPAAPPWNQLPAATSMDYYMGRLWYAQGRTYGAGDIIYGQAGTAGYNFRDSILSVTEAPLMFNGDNFAVPDNAGDIRALRHAINIDRNLGVGPLVVFTRKAIYALDVPITRTQWIASTVGTASEMPLQRLIQDNYGTYSERSIVPVNGDLFYQSTDGIRSLAMALRYFQTWGNVALSSELQRMLAFNDRSLMRTCSGTLFDNRLYQTALPVDTAVGTAYRALAVLDFAQLCNMGAKAPPAWEGVQSGLQILQLFTGDFGGRERAFAVTLSETTGYIDLWEITNDQRREYGDKRIVWFAETPAYTFGDEFAVKVLDSGELWVDKISGTVNLTVEYRVDSNPCWQHWYTTQICAARTTCEDMLNPVCYPEQPYDEHCEAYRTMIRLPKPQAAVENFNERDMRWAYAFQVKITVTGWCRIRGLILHALPKTEAPFDGLKP